MKTKKITFSALFIALALILPQLFHIIGGPTAGAIFLPMHIPVILAGMLISWKHGGLIGVISPLLGFFILGMPQIPMLYLMIVELAVYGIIVGLLYKKFNLNIYLSLIISLIIGRLAKSGVILLALNIFGFTFPAPLGTIPLLITGIPGIFIQLAVIPPLVILFERKYKIE